MASQGPLLAFEDVTKRFGGVTALSGVSFRIQAGKIHALVGENGAGKSTLVKCLVGVHRVDSGRIILSGRPIAPQSSRDARGLGIDIVFQEIELAPNLTVAESIFLAREPVSLGMIRTRRMEEEAAALLGSLAVPVSPRARIETLRTAEKQVVQIARTLAQGAQLLVMDEPTSSLSDFEVDRLLGLLEGLRDSGTTIIYVSHKLHEVFRLADDITVMRDGRHVVTNPAETFTTDSVISAMVGAAGPPRTGVMPRRAAEDDPALTGAITRPQTAVSPSTTARPLKAAGVPPYLPVTVDGHAAPPVLRVDKLSRGRAFRDVSFDLFPCDILGLFGIVGAGRTELVRAIFGLDRPDSGQLTLDGRAVRWRSPADAIAAGLALVPEDRKLQGLHLEESIRRNISLPAISRVSRAGWIDSRAEYALADQAVDRFSIVTRAGVDQAVRFLSGGNQQKVVIAKWLATKPRVLMLDEPTKGIDVGAKREVHALIGRLAAEGAAVILVSSELEEVMALAHRIIVMRAGEASPPMETSQATRESLMRLAVMREGVAAVV
jgi:ABC-type sugar transport system ATPase subunit